MRIVPRQLMRTALLAGAALSAGSCSTGVYNYVQADGPRYTGTAPHIAQAGSPDTLRVVTFNIAFARQVDSAIVVLRRDSSLHDADVILLQEMDAAGTRSIAHALGLHYVYYPAALHPRTDRDVGNAILSRWPIVADAKLVLPHIALFRRTQRVATAATLRVGEHDVRVYSAHLGTLAEIGFGARRDQLRTILADAAQYERVIIGGDMNEPWLGGVMTTSGYDWPTKDGPRTAIIGRVDHIFLRGLGAETSGTVLETRSASDHRPVWVRLLTDA